MTPRPTRRTCFEPVYAAHALAIGATIVTGNGLNVQSWLV
jgi:hypothetical protein